MNFMFTFIRAMITAYHKTKEFWRLLRDPKSAIFKVMAKYVDPKILNNIVRNADIAKLIDPSTLFTALRRATVKETDNIIKELKRLNKDEQRQAIEALNATQSTPINLSSSWVKKGAFIQYRNSTSGMLIIWVNSDEVKENPYTRGTKNNPPKKRRQWYGPYIYPYVKSETWLKMRAATGKNGTRYNPIGAGSWMWHDFLAEWLESQLRTYLLKYKDTMNKQTYEENIQFLYKHQGKFSRLYRQNPLTKSGAPSKAFQRLQESGNFWASHDYHQQLQMDKQAYSQQKQAIIGKYKANLSRDIMSVQSPLYELHKAVNKYESSVRRVRNTINVRRQALKQVKRTFGYTGRKDKK